MANRFLSNIRINDAYTFPASDGLSGQAIITDGAGNLSFGTVSGGGGGQTSSVVYRENFTGDGSTIDFQLTRNITDENVTQIYLDGIYQEKDAYAIIDFDTIRFSAAPPSGHSIEVLYFYAIDAIPQPSTSVIYRDNFTGDGTTTNFTLANSISNEDYTQIYIDGAYQEKDTYSVTGTTLSFTTAPVSGHSVEVISIAGLTTPYSPTTIYQDNFTGNGSTTAFTLQNAVDDEVKTMVYFNGVYQFKGTYTLSGVTITFDAAPANGVAIEVITIASASGFEYDARKVLFYGKASEAITKGDAVMFAGQEGDHFLLAKATQAAISANHEYFLGLANETLAIGDFGYVVEFGSLTEIDTTAYTAGDILWFDAGGSTAGALTTTEPAAPLVKIQVAAVIRSHQNEGVLFVRPTWYHELGELHDVNITSAADKDLLVWDAANGYWENSKTVDTLTATTLSAATLTGTLSTAAQPNVTSVGTLTGLTVSADATVNSLTVGRGAGNGATNTVLGSGALAANTSGIYNTAIGRDALPSNTSSSNNTAIGGAALFANTTGADNTAIGVSTLFDNTTGIQNVALGVNALANNTTASQNTAVGVEALFTNTTGARNSAFGFNALVLNATGNDNAAFGRSALEQNTTGSNNVAVGNNALVDNTTGVNNTALGKSALENNTTANNNTSVGFNSTYYNTTGIDNSALGSFALHNNTTGSYNVAIGKDALNANTTANYNTAVGRTALLDNTTGTSNVAVGKSALENNTTASYNVAIGDSALLDNTTGAENIAIGTDALGNNTTASYNTVIGRLAMYFNTTGAENTAVGKSALQNNTTASFNVAVGREALYLNTTGQDNAAFGTAALRTNTTASNNTAIGSVALYSNTTGANNTAVGVSALLVNTTASNNTAIGHNALLTNTTGFQNVAIGQAALQASTVANNNVAIGKSALSGCTLGGENVAVGKDAGTNLTTGGNNIIIGWNAQPNTATTSNEIVFGNSSITTLRCQTQTISALSDARDKKDVKELVGAEEFIKELRPVSFVWNQRDGQRLGLEDNGFIAQELLEAQEKTGYKVPNLVLNTNPDKLQAAYAALLPTMVSALQSALNRIDELESKIKTLESK